MSSLELGRIFCNPLWCIYNIVSWDNDYVETALDIASVAYSANEFKKNRSFGNAGWLAFDAVMLALPIAPGSGVVRAGIKASKSKAVPRVVTNAAKGRAFETKVLKSNKLIKNTKNVGGTIPDSLTRGVHEVKNVNKQSLTSQIKKQMAYAKANKRTYTLHVAARTKISKPLKKAINNIRGRIKRY